MYYNIEVHTSTASWKVSHRYSEFDRFHTAMLKLVPALRKLALPQKQIHLLPEAAFTPLFLEQRRAELEVSPRPLTLSPSHPHPLALTPILTLSSSRSHALTLTLSPSP